MLSGNCVMENSINSQKREKLQSVLDESLLAADYTLGSAKSICVE